MRRNTLFPWLLFLMMALVSIGCGHPWRIVRQASPNPMHGQTKFAVEPMHFDSMMVGGKTEATYQSGKTPEQQQGWQADKAGMNGEFFATLLGQADGLQLTQGPPPDAQTFVVRPIVTFVEPGFYAYVAAISTNVKLTVQILGPQGVLDEFTVENYQQATMTSPSSGGRMRSAANVLGRYVAAYLKERVTKG
ncbi:MAG: hypothetical protein NVSMB1_13210 [Polyangiales bacterium]